MGLTMSIELNMERGTKFFEVVQIKWNEQCHYTNAEGACRQEQSELVVESVDFEVDKAEDAFEQCRAITFFVRNLLANVIKTCTRQLLTKMGKESWTAAAGYKIFWLKLCECTS